MTRFVLELSPCKTDAQQKNDKPEKKVSAPSRSPRFERARGFRQRTPRCREAVRQLLIMKNPSPSTPTSETMTLKARGTNRQLRVLWMAMFTPGVNGRRGLPYVLVGEPGSTKTSRVKQLASQANMPFEGVLGSLRSPVDFLGVPVARKRQLGAHDQHLSPDGDSEFTYMHYAPAGFSVRSALAKRSVILFDELNTCTPSVQAALLRVLFEGVVGEMELPPGVRMFCAMNETKDAAGGFEIAPPLANRLGWLSWESPSVNEFVSYLTGGDASGMQLNTNHELVADRVDPAVEEAAVDAAFPKAWAVAAGEVAGFLTRRPNLLLSRGNDDTARQWPSPRTWELATRALAGSYVYGLAGEETEMATSAYIGSAAYGEFYTWKKEADLPDPEVLLDGGVAFKHNKARLDRTAAVLTACTSVLSPENAPKRKERTEAMWKLISGLLDDATDVCLPSIASLTKKRLMLGYPDAYKVLHRIEPVMSAAGITRVT